MKIKIIRFWLPLSLVILTCLDTIFCKVYLSESEIRSKLIESAIIIRDQLIKDVDSLQNKIDNGLEPFERTSVNNHIRLLARQGTWWHHIGLLEDKYPFKIIVDSALIAEFAYYQINPGERVAEVGAGMGNFAILLHLVYPDNELYINELGAHQVRVLSNGLDHYLESTDLTIIEGTTRSTMLPKAYFDKIILRNSFHHMQRKKPMLKSLIANLKPGGKLYMIEGLKELGFKCSKALYETEILKNTQKFGLELLSTVIIDNQKILNFRRSSTSHCLMKKFFYSSCDAFEFHKQKFVLVMS